VLFFRDTFETTLAENDAGRYSKVLEMVRWAPSASNRQPWRIILDRSRRAFHFFLQRTAGYPSPGADLQRLDMGIAMCHFELSARELGVDGHWEVLPVEIGALPDRTSYVATWISTAAESSTS
jgi:hypothetical protein